MSERTHRLFMPNDNPILALHVITRLVNGDTQQDTIANVLML